MADEHDRVPLRGVPACLRMDLRDERAGGVDRLQRASGRILVHRRRDAVGREDQRRAFGHFLLAVHEDRSALLELSHDVEVVHDLLADVDRRAVELERALDRVHGTFDPGAVATGRREKDALDQDRPMLLGGLTMHDGAPRIISTGGIVSLHTEVLLFNGVPLLVLAAVYLGITIALAPLVWSERERASALELAFLSLFPAVGVLIACVPPAAVLSRWPERRRLVSGWFRAREAEERATALDRNLDSVADVSKALARAGDEEAVAEALLAEVSSLLDVDFAAVATIDEERREARGLLGRVDRQELDWWPETRIDLDRETSAVAKVARERAPLAVEDVAGSSDVSRRLARATGVKSAAFVPLLVDTCVVAVLVAGDTRVPRAFQPDELTLLQAVAGEGALALDRVRSASELEQALERERLVARIGRNVRSELDLEAVLEVTVRETGRALGVSRAFVRLGEPGTPMPVEAEWDAEGVERVSPRVARKL